MTVSPTAQAMPAIDWMSGACHSATHLERLCGLTGGLCDRRESGRRANCDHDDGKAAEVMDRHPGRGPARSESPLLAVMMVLLLRALPFITFHRLSPWFSRCVLL